MNPRRARSAAPRRPVLAGGAAALTALSTAVGTAVLTGLLTAGPALAANDRLGPSEGADTSAGTSTGEAVLLFVVVPLVSLLLIAAVVLLPGFVKADRYRPAKGWTAPPVWFAGPPDPVAAVETTEHGTHGRGGARGSW